ncbi:MAG: cytochrome c peroxidase, partial [Bacteroidota bacterium]
MRLPALLTLLLVLLVMSACNKDQVYERDFSHYTDEEYALLSETLDLPRQPHPYLASAKKGFTHSQVRLLAEGEAISSSKATLGRVLFYDTKLSANNSVSCASCHDQEKAFADPVALSEGFEGKATLRNSFALGSVISFSDTYGGGTVGTQLKGALFWDNRATTVAQQTAMTLEDPIEMGMELDQLSEKLATSDYYPILFQKAFGDKDITSDRVLMAISHFVNSMVTNNSRFDFALKDLKSGQSRISDFPSFSDSENKGKALFARHCASCHGANMSTTSVSVANNGLDLVYEDQGIGELTFTNESMNGVFKVPLLRNVKLTGPYMHDGRFATLEEVLDHYD